MTGDGCGNVPHGSSDSIRKDSDDCRIQHQTLDQNQHRTLDQPDNMMEEEATQHEAMSVSEVVLQRLRVRGVD